MNHVLLVAALALGAPDIDAIDHTREEAQAQEQFAFCTEPKRPLGNHQKRYCAMAREIEGCKGFVDACDAEQGTPTPDWLARLAAWVGPAANVLLYILVAAIVVVILVPVVSALLQLRRRRKKAAEAKLAPNVAQIVAPEEIPAPDETDPEEALRRAEEHLAQGDHRRALAFSLSAALGALDRRGAIRVAKHRTNGEYVRSCADATARPPLREIVRAVDAVEFGGTAATNESAARVTARAKEIVRAAAVIATLGLLALGCTPAKRGSDPAGDELPIAVLERNGFKVRPLTTSLSTMPVRESSEEDVTPVLPTVMIDVDKVPLEKETQAHLMRWVEAGGVLILFGRIDGWPAELGAHFELATTRDLFVAEPAFGGARVSGHEAFSWKAGVEHETVAFLGKKTYASRRPIGKGFVLGIASDDLFTNIGVMPKHNAAALVTLVRSAAPDGDLRVARAEDGVPPPSNPFAALIAAGLAKGAWHALAAALLLFLAYGIRHARPRAAPGAPRRSFVEHIEATGAFYARARARTHALAAYGRFLELRLRELAPRGADPAAFLAARSGAEPAHVAELYARALAATPDEVPKGDELEIIGELRTMMARVVTERAQPRGGR